ncbi:MAG: fluoride efflux transporter CrcB [Silicimonas sp.]|nr:fluoride efflux transporter CrcB [Silicimonas sp.]
MVNTLVSVALGGAIGASARYLTGLGMLRLFGQTGFPVTIIMVNVLGSFLMGVFVVLADQRGLTHLSPFVMVGVLGGFTTFSAFSLEAVALFERGEIAQAVFYVGASVVCSISALVAGVWIARAVFA